MITLPVMETYVYYGSRQKDTFHFSAQSLKHYGRGFDRHWTTEARDDIVEVKVSCDNLFIWASLLSFTKPESCIRASCNYFKDQSQQGFSGQHFHQGFLQREDHHQGRFPKGMSLNTNILGKNWSIHQYRYKIIHFMGEFLQLPTGPSQRSLSKTPLARYGPWYLIP